MVILGIPPPTSRNNTKKNGDWKLLIPWLMCRDQSSKVMQEIVDHLHDTCMTDENDVSLLFRAPPLAAMENYGRDTYSIFFTAISFRHRDPKCHWFKMQFICSTHDPRGCAKIVFFPSEIWVFVGEKREILRWLGPPIYARTPGGLLWFSLFVTVDQSWWMMDVTYWGDGQRSSMDKRSFCIGVVDYLCFLWVSQLRCLWLPSWCNIHPPSWRNVFLVRTV